MDKILALTTLAIFMAGSLYFVLEIEEEVKQLKMELAQEKLNVIALSGVYEDKNNLCKDIK